ncbi:hypothetical protein EDD15DRAFT_2248210 [Pisolithus albus]|nr:hypothetical protein EDD15DRAFT_2248210 [Pisolithus albus]
MRDARLEEYVDTCEKVTIGDTSSSRSFASDRAPQLADNVNLITRYDHPVGRRKRQPACCLFSCPYSPPSPPPAEPRGMPTCAPVTHRAVDGCLLTSHSSCGTYGSIGIGMSHGASRTGMSVGHGIGGQVPGLHDGMLPDEWAAPAAAAYGS